MAEGIKVSKRLSRVGDRLSVTLDTNFLDTAWARKVYRLNGLVKFPATAHYHDCVEIVIPHLLDGRVSIAYRVDGEVRHVDVEPGYSYEVPPMVPHQTYGDAQGLVEVWSPTRSYVSPGKLVDTDDDFFAGLPVPPAGR